MYAGGGGGAGRGGRRRACGRPVQGAPIHLPPFRYRCRYPAASDYAAGPCPQGTGGTGDGGSLTCASSLRHARSGADCEPLPSPAPCARRRAPQQIDSKTMKKMFSLMQVGAPASPSDFVPLNRLFLYFGRPNEGGQFECGRRLALCAEGHSAHQLPCSRAGQLRASLSYKGRGCQ